MKSLAKAGRTFLTIREISGPLVFVESVTGVGYGELVEVTTPSGEERTGQVIDVSEEVTVVQVFEGTSGLDTKTTAIRFTGGTIKLPVSMDMLGRVLILLTVTDNITLKCGDTIKTGYDQFAFVEVVDQLVSANLSYDIATLEGQVPHPDSQCLNHLPHDDKAYYEKFLETEPQMMLPKKTSDLNEEQLQEILFQISELKTS